MRNFARLSLGLSLGCLILVGDASAQSQLEVRTTSISQLAGAEGLRTIGNAVLIEDAKGIEFAPGVLIEVTSPAANVEVEVTDRDRRRVEFKPLVHENGTTFYLVTAPGKAWVDVTAIDFSANIYKRQTGLVIDVPQAGPVGPVPGPAPTLPEPIESLKTLAAPITQKLSADPVRAAAISDAMLGFAAGVSVAMPRDVAAFAKVNTEALRSLAIPPGNSISGEVADMMAAHVGIERDANKQWKDRPLVEADRVKIAEVYTAVAWAARQK